MLKNALGKAHSKNKKGKACLRTIEQEDIARVGAEIDQIAADIEAGVYQALISKFSFKRILRYSQKSFLGNFKIFFYFFLKKFNFLNSLTDRT